MNRNKKKGKRDWIEDEKEIWDEWRMKIMKNEEERESKHFERKIPVGKNCLKEKEEAFISLFNSPLLVFRIPTVLTRQSGRRMSKVE